MLFGIQTILIPVEINIFCLCGFVDYMLYYANHMHRHPANARRSLDAGLMLGQRLRRWLNNKPASGQRLVSAWHRHRTDNDILTLVMSD